MALRIRRAGPADYETVCALFAQVDALHREARPDVFRAGQGPPRTREFFDGVLASPNAAIFVGEQEGAIAGFVQVGVEQTPDVPVLVPQRFGWISDLVVNPELRRSGVGRALVAEAERWAQALGAVALGLNVFEFNRGAIAFYEELGYAPSRRTMAKPLAG